MAKKGDNGDCNHSRDVGHGSIKKSFAEVGKTINHEQNLTANLLKNSLQEEGEIDSGE